jgi:hypothetical protein
MPLNCSFKVSIARAQRVKHAAHLNTIVGVRIGAALGRDHDVAFLRTGGTPGGVVIVRVAQDVAHRGGQFGQKFEAVLISSRISGRQISRQGHPNSGDRGNQMQLPTIDPAVPARLGPVCFGINRRVWNDASRTILFVPDAAAGAQYGTVDGGCSATRRPGLDIVTSVRPKPPICAGSVSGIAAKRRAQVRLVGKRPA